MISEKSWYGNILLTITAVIWGLAFIAQSASMKYVGPFTFQCCRTFLGMLALAPVLAVRLRGAAKRKHGTGRGGKDPLITKQMIRAGVLCGLAFTSACILQQFAMKTTDAGKAAFITALYLVILPVLGIVVGRKVPVKIWFCILLCLVGIWFLSISGATGIGTGDLLLLACAFLFAVQMMLVDHFVQQVDGVWISFVQLATSTILMFLPMVIIERPSWEMIAGAKYSILYAGVLSCGIAYTLQILGQKYTSPVTAGLIMSTESIFALIGGILILHQIPTMRELAGCALVFAAVILSQADLGRKKRRKEQETEGA